MKGPKVCGGWQELSATSAEPSVTVAPEDRALLFYTSGTTGLPKVFRSRIGNLAFQLNTLLTARTCHQR